MRKYLNAFWVSPAAVAAVLLLSYITAFTFFSGHLTDFTEVWGPTDWATYVCYLILFSALFVYRTDFRTKSEKTYG